MTEPRDPLIEYYARRAAEYEGIYQRSDPVARRELRKLHETIRAGLRDRRVLEVACGTGYWTEDLAQVSESVTAIDATADVLEEARKKNLGPGVEFLRADAYRLDAVPGSYDGALAAFWLSHVPRDRVAAFLEQLHARVEPGSRIVLIDNVFVPGLGGELIQSQQTEDTFKLRSLRDGGQHRVLKNYYSEDDLRQLLSGTQDLGVWMGGRYWSVTYRTDRPEEGDR